MYGRVRVGGAWLLAMLFSDIISRVYVKPIAPGYSRQPPKAGRPARG